jgi:hypothetical protein
MELIQKLRNALCAWYFFFLFIGLALRQTSSGAAHPADMYFLTDQIGSQIDAGFHLINFYEDCYTDVKISEFIATLAVKP